jgi:hypothetical protein
MATYYTREEAAAKLGVTPEHLDQMRLTGEVAGDQQGGVWRYRMQDIDARAQSMAGPSDSGSSDEFNLTTETGMNSGSEAQALPESNRPGSDPDLSSDLDISLPPEGGPPTPLRTTGAGGLKNPSVIKLAPEDMPVPPNEDSLDFGQIPTGPSQVNLGDAPAPPSAALRGPASKGPVSKGPPIKFQPESGAVGASQVSLGEVSAPTPGSSKKGPAPEPPRESEVRLDMDTGSFEFTLSVDSSGRLGDSAAPASGTPKSAPRSAPADQPPSSQKIESNEPDSDVRLDFDPGAATTPDDNLGFGDKPDSDIRIDPVSEIRSRPSAPLSQRSADLMQTEQIDLDAELRQADEASMAKRPSAPQSRGGKGLPSPMPPGKTQGPAGGTPTMLPTTSPFELSEDDLDVGSSQGDSGPGTSPLIPGDSSMGAARAGGSEFELTLAPEDETSPLNLGDDEDVDLGGLPGKGDAASNRAELSGINLQAPADSGILLEKKNKTKTGAKAKDDAVDFELTIDEDGSSGPKTLRGKLAESDSDSEFELTLDEGSSKSLPKPSKISGFDSAGDQKDIFETDFDLQSAGLPEESGSQAVALDEPDTDLESSDFDLAIDEGDAESGSQVMPLPEDSESMEVPKRSKVSKVSKVDSSLSEADNLLDEDLMASEEAPAEEAVEEEAAAGVPAAQADWGMFPLLFMVPCVLIMFIAGLMSYELVHSMWGYHQTTKPAGLLVETFAGLFKSDEPPPPAAPAAGAPKGQ